MCQTNLQRRPTAQFVFMTIYAYPTAFRDGNNKNKTGNGPIT
jgi:hypothetical protein